MVEVSFSSSFKRAFKKRVKANVDLSTRFWQKLELFTNDPFDQRNENSQIIRQAQGIMEF